MQQRQQGSWVNVYLSIKEAGEDKMRPTVLLHRLITP